MLWSSQFDGNCAEESRVSMNLCQSNVPQDYSIFPNKIINYSRDDFAMTATPATMKSKSVNLFTLQTCVCFFFTLNLFVWVYFCFFFFICNTIELSDPAWYSASLHAPSYGVCITPGKCCWLVSRFEYCENTPLQRFPLNCHSSKNHKNDICSVCAK